MGSRLTGGGLPSDGQNLRTIPLVIRVGRNTDAQGRAVHSDCYTEKLAAQRMDLLRHKPQWDYPPRNHRAEAGLAAVVLVELLLEIALRIQDIAKATSNCLRQDVHIATAGEPKIQS